MLITLRRAFPSILFFFNDTATTEIYTLSLHDALPILDAHILERVARILKSLSTVQIRARPLADRTSLAASRGRPGSGGRSEEHTSELQSRLHLVCRLLLEKKKNKTPHTIRCATGSGLQ